MTDIGWANGITDPNRVRAEQRLLIPGSSGTPPALPSAGTYYTVRREDALAKMAVHFRASVWSIAQINNIAGPNVISPGQRLLIVAASSRTRPGLDTWAVSRLRGTGFDGRWSIRQRPG
jgi:LysM repeat protein